MPHLLWAKNRVELKTPFDRRVLVCQAVVMGLLMVSLMPIIFEGRLSPELGSYAFLSTFSIGAAILAMLPMFIAIRRCGTKGAIATWLIFATCAASLYTVRTGVFWPPQEIVGWLLGNLGLVSYGLIAGQLYQVSQRLAHAYDTIQKQALTDVLTDLPNHRSLMEQIEKEFDRVIRHGRPLALIFFDADRFKCINDMYGHAAGDIVLRSLGERVRRILRTSDTFGRYGGEEFLVVLPEADITQASRVAERIRSAVASETIALPGTTERIQVTISLGVAIYPTDGATIQELLNAADKAMYWAKKLGRNQVCTAQEVEQANGKFSLSDLKEGEEGRDATQTKAATLKVQPETEMVNHQAAPFPVGS